MWWTLVARRVLAVANTFRHSCEAQRHLFFSFFETRALLKVVTIWLTLIAQLLRPSGRHARRFCWYLIAGRTGILMIVLFFHIDPLLGAPSNQSRHECA